MKVHSGLHRNGPKVPARTKKWSRRARELLPWLKCKPRIKLDLVPQVASVVSHELNRESMRSGKAPRYFVLDRRAVKLPSGGRAPPYFAKGPSKQASDDAFGKWRITAPVVL